MYRLQPNGSFKIGACKAKKEGHIVPEDTVNVPIRKGTGGYSMSNEYCDKGWRYLHYLVEKDSNEVNVAGCEKCPFNKER